ncbi:MAG: hypothetical protein ACR2I7_06650 [Geodermatophilaceae bacterium]
MTRPDQPAPGENTSESGQDTGPVEGAGESGDVDPREPMEDASDMTPSTGDNEGTEAPDPLEPPD